MASDPVSQAVLRLGGERELSSEYLVIGSGAGGALAAEVISQAGHEVLVLEEGPAPSAPHNVRDAFSWFRDGGAIPVYGNAEMVFGEGRVLGGSTMLNAGILHRTSEDALAGWVARYAIRDLSPGQLSALHDEVEAMLHAGTLPDASPQGTLLARGAQEAKLDGAVVPLALDAAGQRKGNVRTNLLAAAAGRGVRVLADCAVERLVLRAGKARGVVARVATPSGVRRIQISAKHVVVAAGALQTPLLLRRSGVTKNVGDNLRFHPMLKISAELAGSAEAHAHLMPSYQVRLTPKVTLGAALSLQPYTASSFSANWDASSPAIRNAAHVASYYVALSPEGRGSVRNLPFSGGYLVRSQVTQKDVAQLAGGLRTLCELLLGSGATRLHAAVSGMPPLSSRTDVERAFSGGMSAKRLSLSAVHAFGSCPIGEAPDCPLDSHGRLRGFSNILVADASALPDSPGANPQGPLMAVALRNIRNFLS